MHLSECLAVTLWGFCSKLATVDTVARIKYYSELGVSKRRPVGPKWPFQCQFRGKSGMEKVMSGSTELSGMFLAHHSLRVAV